MKRGVWLIIAIVVVLILGVVAFFLARPKKAATPKQVTLTIWSPFDESSVYQTISKDFLKSNTNVTLDFKFIDSTDAKDYEAKVVNAIADGRGPDIWLVRNDWIPKQATKSEPAIISGKTDPITYAKQYLLPSVVDMNTYNGKLYGVPMFGDALALIYNTTLYDSWVNSLPQDQQKTAGLIPQTWDDLKAQAARFSQSKNGVVTRSAIALGTTDNTFAPADIIGALLNQAGANILSNDGKSVAFNVAQTKNGATTFPAIDAMSFYSSFALPNSGDFSWSSNLGDPINAFMNQKTGLLIGYYSTLQTIVNKKPSFGVQVAPFVQLNSLVSTRTDFGITWSHVVNKDSANKDLAWSYLGYLMNKDVLASYNAAAHHLSVANATPVSIDPSSLLGPENAPTIFLDELQTAKSYYKPEWQLTDEILQDTVNLIVNSAQTPQSAVDTAASRFKTFVTP